jgi:hypothetical protein
VRSVFAGIDHLLAQHIAHLFIRDPLTLFQEKIHLDDANEADHFEVSPPVQVHMRQLSVPVQSWSQRNLISISLPNAVKN